MRFGSIDEQDKLALGLLQKAFTSIRQSAIQEIFSNPEFEHLYGYSVIKQKLKNRFLINFEERKFLMSLSKQENLEVDTLIELSNLLDPIYITDIEKNKNQFTDYGSFFRKVSEELASLSKDEKKEIRSAIQEIRPAK